MSDANYFTAVYRGVQTGDEAAALGGHPKIIAMSWSHALHDRDDALDTAAKLRDRIAELEAALAEAQKDAARYRGFLRGGPNVPSHSTRWPRWEVRYWDGRHWNTMFADQLDAAIDAAMQEGKE